MATCSLDREGILTSGIQWSHAEKPICKSNSWYISPLLDIFWKTFFKGKHFIAFSLFVVSYLSLFCKVGRDYNSWLRSRSAFVISCDLSMREGVYLQHRICLLFKNSLLCNAFIWSEWENANMFSVALFYFIWWAEKCWRYQVTTSTNEYDQNFYNLPNKTRLASNYSCAEKLLFY